MSRTMRNAARWVLAAAVLTSVTGCVHKVWVMTPPDVDLETYGKIGLIELPSSDPGLTGMVNQQFLQAVHDAQPGARVLELGDERQVLKSIGHARLDAEAFKAIAEKHDLDAIFTGSLMLTGISPRIGVTMSLIEVHGSLDMQATMSARLIEAETGATVWTCSSRGDVTIAHADITSEGTGTIGVTDPARTYAPLVEGLAWRVTDDFRAHYARHRPENVPPHYVPSYPDGVEVFGPPQLTRADG